MFNGKPGNRSSAERPAVWPVFHPGATYFFSSFDFFEINYFNVLSNIASAVKMKNHALHLPDKTSQRAADVGRTFPALLVCFIVTRR